MFNKIKGVLSGHASVLLSWFLLLSLLPLSLISWTSYNDATKDLTLAAKSEMQTLANAESRYIENWFKYRITDLKVQARRSSSRVLLTTLVEDFSDSKLKLQDYTKSYRWLRQVDDIQDELLTLSWDLDYIYSISLIDLNGNVLYSTLKDDNLGLNIYDSTLAERPFSIGIDRSLNTGEAFFSDIERVKNKVIVGNFSALILDEFGNKIGAMSVQIKMNDIFSIVEKNTEYSSSLAQYIVGEKGYLRSPISSEEEILSRRIENISDWFSEITSSNGTKGAGEFTFYIGANTELVYGSMHLLNIPGNNWAIITEIDEKDLYKSANQLRQRSIIYALITTIIVIFMAIYQALRITQPLSALSKAMRNIENGYLDQTVENKSDHELGILIDGFNNMISKLQSSSLERESQLWMRGGLDKLNNLAMGDKDLAIQAEGIINFLCQLLKVNLGTFYVVEDKQIKLRGSYALKTGSAFQSEFEFGEGIVGQAALDGVTTTVSNIPLDYLSLHSSLGESQPNVILIIPIKWNEQVIALLEFASYCPLTKDQNEFLTLAEPIIATAILASISRDTTQYLLEASQAQSEELQSREEELQTSQRALEEQNQKLQTQEEELRTSNESLQDQTQKLVSLNELTEEKNRELQIKSDELTKSNQYKSEFLANMSHELRTPLNSVLVLSKLLGNNKSQNLDNKQIEFANTIHSSGNDLLTLINDILDLAKIESGSIELDIGEIVLENFITELKYQFEPLAEEKGLSFSIEHANAPGKWHSDARKLGQIIKNLLSNAIKFTEQGNIALEISLTESNETHSIYSGQQHSLLSISVKDEGIGIPTDMQESIFDAFKQADGATNRKYGGTGLGLSISRELALILGGELHVKSDLHEGSKFILTIPYDVPEVIEAKVNSSIEAISDDREALNPDSRSILIIEDDPIFANILIDISKERGFQVLHSQDGQSGIQLAQTYLPSGIILDIGLPGIDGWQVLEALKNDLNTRHIPVHFISANDNIHDAEKLGAVGFISKPVNVDSIYEALSSIESIIDREVKTLMVLEKNTIHDKEIRSIIGDGDVNIISMCDSDSALTELANNHFDCIILGYGNPLNERIKFLDKLVHNESIKRIPIVVYSENELGQDEETLLIRYAKHLTIKSAITSDHLFRDTALFLHRVDSQLPFTIQRNVRMLHDNEITFAKKKVLIVDDDLRNVFALSAVLEEKKMDVSFAKNGLEALRKLEEIPDIDIVLMDIMMPKMDGYEATKKIRDQLAFQKLPIIALTANAMKDDRRKCIEVGASDYITKPIDNEQLLSVMRVWLSS